MDHRESDVSKMKLFILGHGRHGKDTVADMLLNRYGLKFKSSSMFCAELVVRPALARDGIVYASLEACYEDRANRRARWFDAIDDYNTPDASRLSRAIFGEYDMYVGLRSRREFLVARKFADLTVWVDAFERVLPEGAESCTVLRSDADIIIDNSTTEEDLRTRVRAIFDVIIERGDYALG